jgi:hypothetical protein
MPHTTCVDVLLKIMDSNDLDPFVVFSAVVGMPTLARETGIGGNLESLLQLAASEASVTTEELIVSFRARFYGTAKEGMLGVHRVRSAGDVTWRHSKKKEVLLLYLQSVQIGSPQMPTLVQIIYVGKDNYSGARVHQVFKNAQDAIVSCRDLFFGASPPLSIMEVPNKIQGVGKFYIDWDMKMERFGFLNGTPCDMVDQARELALQTPSKICKIFIDLGHILNDTVVQVIVKEGSRSKVGGTGIQKISFHFVFNLLGSSAQLQCLSAALFKYIEKHGGTLTNTLRDGNSVITDISQMNGYGSLIGIDMHPYSNPEQGLAMGLSRKHLQDPYTRFVEILHVKGGVDLLSEIPCSSIWTGRMLLNARTQPDIR